MKKIVIWGAGSYGVSAYDKLKNEEYDILDILDSNPKRIGNAIGNHVVQNVYEKELFNYDVVLLSAKKWEDMYLHAKKVGVSDKNIKIWDGEKIIDMVDCYSKGVHSQDGEELFLREEFADVKDGFFVDVGAYHPLRFSNTLWAYRCGWKGINIEPNINNYELFKYMRPNDINVNIGISSIRTKMKYYMFDEDGLNTFDKDRADFLVKQNNYKLKNVMEIEVITLQELLDRYNVKYVDFLDIDVEGKEIDVIQSVDFDKVDIKFVLVEQLSMNLEDVLRSEIAILMKMYGYDPISKFDRTVVYKKR